MTACVSFNYVQLTVSTYVLAVAQFTVRLDSLTAKHQRLLYSTAVLGPTLLDGGTCITCMYCIVISPKQCKIGRRLLWRTNRKSHTRFRLLPKSKQSIKHVCCHWDPTLLWPPGGNYVLLPIFLSSYFFSLRDATQSIDSRPMSSVRLSVCPSVRDV